MLQPITWPHFSIPAKLLNRKQYIQTREREQVDAKLTFAEVRHTRVLVYTRKDKRDRVCSLSVGNGEKWPQ